MKYVVDDSCIGCGMCAGTCPDVFSLNGEKAQAVDADVPAQDETAAADAMNGCPVGAIHTKQ